MSSRPTSLAAVSTPAPACRSRRRSVLPAWPASPATLTAGAKTDHEPKLQLDHPVGAGHRHFRKPHPNPMRRVFRAALAALARVLATLWLSQGVTSLRHAGWLGRVLINPARERRSLNVRFSLKPTKVVRQRNMSLAASDCRRGRCIIQARLFAATMITLNSSHVKARRNASRNTRSRI